MAAPIVALGLAGGVVATFMSIEANDKAEAQAKSEREEQRRELAASAAADALKAEEELERENRAAAIPDIENSVSELAASHAADDIIGGPVIEVSCSPVGGSTDDLTQLTTIFSCFVSTKDNGDGTHSGYYYNATMNWATGSLTYGFGAP